MRTTDADELGLLSNRNTPFNALVSVIVCSLNKVTFVLDVAFRCAADAFWLLGVTDMAAEGEQRAASEVFQALVRHLNCLNDENKSTRKRALASIQREIEDKRLSSGAMQEVFGELLKPLLKCLSDPMEKCRELSIQIIAHCVRNVPRPEEALPYLIPAVAQRLGNPEIVEPSEELRLALTELLALLVEVCGKKLGPYLDEMIRILQRTITDPFPDVKKESCKCAANYAKCIPDLFHMQSESLIKPLMQTISHQHSKVRIAAIQATGAIIQFGNGKSVDDVLSHLAQRLFDDAPQVRQAVTIVVGEWLLNLRDRYSYFHKLIPLLLSSSTDEIPEIRQLAEKYWDKTGSQWETENEEDLKDKLDFSAPSPSCYPAGVRRPGLGCQELIFRNLSKILPAISHDITDWVVGTRIKSSQLLAVLLLHAEDHTTQHMELILSTLYHSCLDEEQKVVQSSVQSAELIGTFVNPEVFLKLILNSLKKSPLASHLMVLAACIRGSSRERLKPHLNQISSVLSHAETCQGSEKVLYLEQLLNCVDSLIGACQQDCEEVSLYCMKTLITILASPAAENLYQKVQEVLLCLAKVQGLAGVHDLYRRHIQPLLEWTCSNHQHWTSYSVERVQFEVIVTESGPVIGENLHLLVPVLNTCLQPTQEPQMRLKLFTALSKLMGKADETLNSQGQFHNHSQAIIKDILVPNLKWHAGRTAAAIRTIAVSCLWVLLQSEVLSKREILQVQDVLIPPVITTLEEDSKMSRLVSCRIIRALLSICEQHVDPDKLNKIYPEILKRLDDASDEVRVTAAKTLSVWFKCIHDDYDRTTYKSHLEFLYRGLLVHLDDPDTTIQATVFEVLKEGSVIYPSLLAQEIEAVRDKHRTATYCDRLLHRIEELNCSKQTEAT
ncbi:dynein axonemal assembly factor 5 [Spea bombifrons]|uniref:dynein axonemal assembly factor 5 n=1 Tax=Spea bombifrons TaxID=233779 RepID=UPI00234A83CB|nr:dynein axonemal assembly factor 5 [Spea bombifrons]